MRKILSVALFVSYLAILIWLVLFKFSFNISAVLDRHHRSLNLIPFAAPSLINGAINYREMIFNCLFFVPFGLLLCINFKKIGLLPKIAFIKFFSLAAELIQYIFAIGATDITDVITNTFGGLIGLGVFSLCNKFISHEKLEKILISVGVLMLVLILFFLVSIRFGRRL
jgi:glycopeptide antibiotics resistance protein